MLHLTEFLYLATHLAAIMKQQRLISCNRYSYVWMSGNQSACFDPRWPPVNYRFWAGSQSVVVVARQHRLTSKYLIATTVQPQSNMVGNAPLSVNISFMLNGHNVSLESRRQGSVYVLDNATGTPSLTQLDSWHESSHPSWWSKDFHFEAEGHHVEPSAQPMMPSAANSSVGLASVLTVRRHDARDPYDFVGSATFVSLQGNSISEYYFQPRDAHGEQANPTNYRMYQLVASGRGSGACLIVQVRPVSSTIEDHQLQKLCFPSISESSVSRGDSVVSLAVGVEHVVWLQAESGARVDVDWFRLELQQ